nr:hypothetical protein [Tanacetum cinerariifolium]
TTLEGVNTRVTELAAVQEQDTQDIYGVIKDTQGEIRALQAREQARAGAPEGASSSIKWHQREEPKANYKKMAPKKAASKQTTRLNPCATLNLNQAPSTTTTTVTNAQLQAMIDQGVNVALAARDANRTGDDSHTSGTGVRRTERVTRECTYQDFMKCQPLHFKGTEGVVELT